MAQRYKRTHYLINTEIQIGYIFTLFVPLIIVGILFLGLMHYTVQDTAQEIQLKMSQDIDAIIEASQAQDSILSSPEMVAMITHMRTVLYEEPDVNLSTQLKGEYVRLFILTFLLGSILLVIAAIHFSHKFVGPLYHITASCKRVAEGDYREIIHLRSGDKLEHLAENFNLMVSITRMRLAELSSDLPEEVRKKISNNLKI